MATNATPANAGTISVPMSSVLDALKGKLSEAERTALFEQLIGFRATRVAPGDLITSTLFNQMLSDIDALSIRISKLESVPPGPVIDRIEPEGVDKQVSSRVTIVGRNFRPDDVATQALFGDVAVGDFLLESDESRIILTIPDGLQSLPADVPVSVISGGRQSNSVTIRVVPKVVVATGAIVVRYQGGPIDRIEASRSEPYILMWRVTSQINVQMSFELSPVLTNAQGASAADWRAQIVMDPGPITLQPGQSQDVQMTLVRVPNNGTRTELSVRARSTTGSFEGTAAPLSLIVGEITPVSDTRAVIAVRQFAPTADLAPAQIDSKAGFEIAKSKSLNLPMQVSASNLGAGFYRFEATVEPGAPASGGGAQTGRWTVGPITAAFDVAANATKPFSLPITSTSLADATTVSHVTVTAKCFDSNTATTPKFISFLRVPMRGKA